MSKGRTLVRPEWTTLPAGDISPTEWETVYPAALTAKRRTVDALDVVDLSEADNTAALQSVLDQASGQAISDGVEAYTVYLPAGVDITTSDAILMPPRVNIQGDGPNGTMIRSTHGGPAFVLDPSATPDSASRRTYWRFENMTLHGPDRTTAGSLGIMLNNGLYGQMNNVNIMFFETGMILEPHSLANGAACYYNDFHSVNILSGAHGLIARDVANTNKFFGGSIRGNTERGVLLEHGPWGGPNNVEFFGTTLESNGNATNANVRIEGQGNGFYGCRLESSAIYDIHLTATAARNRINSFISSTHPTSRIRDDSPTGRNMVLTDGHMHIGDAASSQIPAVLSANRSSYAHNKPMVKMVDSDATVGSIATGFDYTFRTPGSRLMTARYDDGTTIHAAVICLHPTPPEGVIAAPRGSICLVTSSIPGEPGLYVKESGSSSNTGWVKK